MRYIPVLPKRSRALLAGLLLAAISFTFASERPASAATATVYVRGSVTCPEGQQFAGAWVTSSGGGGDFASKAIYPGTGSRMAKISRTLSNISVPSKISLNVGCGIVNGDQWRYVFNGQGAVTAPGTGTVFINLACTTASCTTAARGLPGSTSVNPAAGVGECTYRAAEFWKQMTGSYPGWGGNAGEWDTRARDISHWNIRGWAEPDSLMVWQPGSTSSSFGHVGYVADTRVSSGATQVKIYDRNWDGDPTNVDQRDGVWIGIPAGAQFIRVPPRFDPHNR